MTTNTVVAMTVEDQTTYNLLTELLTTLLLPLFQYRTTSADALCVGVWKPPEGGGVRAAGTAAGVGSNAAVVRRHHLRCLHNRLLLSG